MAAEQAMTYAGWPVKLIEIADVVGADGAMQISRRYGGRSLYVPSRPIPGHRLEVLLGRAAYHALIAAYGGTELRDIPLASALTNKEAVIRSLARAHPDMSRRRIAETARTTERHVRRVLNDDRPDREYQQLTLWGD